MAPHEGGLKPSKQERDKTFAAQYANMSVAELMAATTAEIIRELIEAHKLRKDINLNKLKTKIGNGLKKIFFPTFFYSQN